MTTIKRSERTSLYFLFFIFISLVVGLASAYVAQFIFHIEPCQLCYTQRYLYGASLIMVFLTLFFSCMRHLSFLTLLCSFLFAVFHVGVEQKWWEGPRSCVQEGEQFVIQSDTSQKTSQEEHIMALKKHLSQKKFVPCDQITWRIFTLPATVLNATFLFVLCCLHFIVLRSCRKKKYSFQR